MHGGQILLKARIYSFGDYIVFCAKFADKKNAWIFSLYMSKVQADLKV
jgi:hypothetical protein